MRDDDDDDDDAESTCDYAQESESTCHWRVCERLVQKCVSEAWGESDGDGGDDSLGGDGDDDDDVAVFRLHVIMHTVYRQLCSAVELAHRGDSPEVRMTNVGVARHLLELLSQLRNSVGHVLYLPIAEQVGIGRGWCLISRIAVIEAMVYDTYPELLPDYRFRRSDFVHLARLELMCTNLRISKYCPTTLTLAVRNLCAQWSRASRLADEHGTDHAWQTDSIDRYLDDLYRRLIDTIRTSKVAEIFDSAYVAKKRYDLTIGDRRSRGRTADRSSSSSSRASSIDDGDDGDIHRVPATPATKGHPTTVRPKQVDISELEANMDVIRELDRKARGLSTDAGDEPGNAGGVFSGASSSIDSSSDDGWTAMVGSAGMYSTCFDRADQRRPPIARLIWEVCRSMFLVRRMVGFCRRWLDPSRLRYDVHRFIPEDILRRRQVTTDTQGASVSEVDLRRIYRVARWYCVLSIVSRFHESYDKGHIQQDITEALRCTTLPLDAAIRFTITSSVATPTIGRIASDFQPMSQRIYFDNQLVAKMARYFIGYDHVCEVTEERRRRLTEAFTRLKTQAQQASAADDQELQDRLVSYRRQTPSHHPYTLSMTVFKTFDTMMRERDTSFSWMDENVLLDRDGPTAEYCILERRGRDLPFILCCSSRLYVVRDDETFVVQDAYEAVMVWTLIVRSELDYVYYNPATVRQPTAETAIAKYVSQRDTVRSLAAAMSSGGSAADVDDGRSGNTDAARGIRILKQEISSLHDIWFKLKQYKPYVRRDALPKKS